MLLNDGSLLNRISLFNRWLRISQTYCRYSFHELDVLIAERSTTMQQ